MTMDLQNNDKPQHSEQEEPEMRERMKNVYGGMKRTELMDRYFPDLLKHWGKARLSMLNKEGGLSLCDRELIILGMEICMRHRDVEAHTVLALVSGATSKQIAAVVGLCMAVHGMYSYDERGVRALKTAEDYDADPEAAILKVNNLRGGYDASMQPHDTP
ncbi:MAG: carboxymuconolactone decarboxylase family protein [Deltaproteobacteria bacterium]|nr:carboxymuconolactone decarboxylase family protein [Deltaproteobacteria bacterium]